MDYKDIIQRYVEKEKTAAEKVVNLEKMRNDQYAKAQHYFSLAARAMTRYHCLDNEIGQQSVNWREHILKPLIKEVSSRTGITFDTSDLRTYGLRAECPVFGSYNNTNGAQKECSLTFTFGHSNHHTELHLFLDTGKRNGRFQPGSIGAINNFDKETIEVHSVDDVINNLRERFPDIQF